MGAAVTASVAVSALRAGMGSTARSQVRLARGCHGSLSPAGGLQLLPHWGHGRSWCQSTQLGGQPTSLEEIAPSPIKNTVLLCKGSVYSSSHELAVLRVSLSLEHGAGSGMELRAQHRLHCRHDWGKV